MTKNRARQPPSSLSSALRENHASNTEFTTNSTPDRSYRNGDESRVAAPPVQALPSGASEGAIAAFPDDQQAEKDHNQSSSHTVNDREKALRLRSQEILRLTGDEDDDDAAEKTNDNEDDDDDAAEKFPIKSTNTSMANGVQSMFESSVDTARTVEATPSSSSEVTPRARYPGAQRMSARMEEIQPISWEEDLDDLATVAHSVVLIADQKVSVTATAVTREELEEEVRRRILDTAVRAEAVVVVPADEQEGARTDESPLEGFADEEEGFPLPALALGKQLADSTRGDREVVSVGMDEEEDPEAAFSGKAPQSALITGYRRRIKLLSVGLLVLLVVAIAATVVAVSRTRGTPAAATTLPVYQPRPPPSTIFNNKDDNDRDDNDRDDNNRDDKGRNDNDRDDNNRDDNDRDRDSNKDRDGDDDD